MHRLLTGLQTGWIPELKCTRKGKSVKAGSGSAPDSKLNEHGPIVYGLGFRIFAPGNRVRIPVGLRTAGLPSGRESPALLPAN